MTRLGLLSLLSAAVLATVPLAGGSAPASADGGYRLITADTGAGSHPVRWNPCQEAITYTVNSRLAKQKGKSSAQARATAQREVVTAMGKVSAATGITFRFAGATTEIPRGGSWSDSQGPADEIVIAYVDRDKPATRSDLLSAGAWGQGGQVYAYEGSTVVAGRGFVLIDRDKAVTMKTGFGGGPRRGNLILHEVAHVMGLDHVSDRAQLMFPTMSSATPNGFAAGDLAGLSQVGAAAGCIPDAASFWEGS